MKRHLSLRIVLTICLCLSLQLLFSQSNSINLNGVISGNRQYEATQKITLSPGFKYSQESGSNFEARIVQPDGGSYTFTEPTQSSTLPINTSYPVGTTPVIQDVSSTGAGTYNIPIKVSPGVAGMEPNISLVYNSQSGEGLLGLGWNIAGLSSITRTTSNWYHEGFINNLQWNANDRFALDGQRLISVGTSEYRTEIESFLKITSYGTAGDPSYFKVETKDGKILYYGNTANSRIEAQARSQALSWNLNRIEDRNGNYITINYYENHSTGESYPLNINYTGTSSISPFNTIEFSYQPRTIPLVSYIAGSKVTTSNLLKYIYVKSEGTTASRYQMFYNQTTSRLTEIVENGNSLAKLNSTMVNWGSTNSGLIQTTGFNDSQLSGRYYGDFNGDGRTDLVMIKSSTWYRYLANSSGNLILQTSGAMPTNYNTSAPHNQAYPGDYNGDGKMDLLVFRLESGDYSISFLLSTSTGFTTYNYETFPFISLIFYLLHWRF